MLFGSPDEYPAGQIETLKSFLENCWRNVHQRDDEEPTALDRNKANGENVIM
jgi:hypothetical protein